MLNFLLLLAWHRGYLMYKFFTLEMIPPPGSLIDPVKIVDQIIAMAGNAADGDFNLGSQIEITLQQLLSWASEAEKVQATFQQFQIEPITSSFILDWGAAVRSAHGSGILAARSEIYLTKSTS